MHMVGTYQLSIAAGKIVSTYKGYTNLPTVLYSMGVFTFIKYDLVKTMKFDIVSKIVNFLNPYIFGVYLIHAHADFSPWSWEFFNLPQYISNVSFPFVQIGVVIGIFVFCAGIDLARKYTIGKLETSQLLHSICECVEKKVLNVIKNMSLR